MKIVTAIAVILSVIAAGANSSSADAHGKKYTKKHAHYARGMKPQVRGYINRGYAYEYEYQRPLYDGIYAGRNGSSDLTFWERVNSDPHGSGVVSNSGL